MEIVNTTVLQEAAHNTDDADIFADAFDTGTQTADAANDQVNLHTCTRSFVKQFDDALVGQGIHLKNQAAFLALLLIPDLAAYHAFDTVAQVDGSDEQFAKIGFGGITGQVIEEVGCISTDIFIHGEHADVFVDISSDVIVVAGSQMHIATNVVAFLRLQPALSWNGFSGPASHR